MSQGIYDSALSGPQMDTALLDMANHTSERYAKGTVEGEPVTSGEGYHDNAKYYAEQAASVIPGEYTDAVRFDIDQTAIKSESEKAQARKNIGAGASNRNLIDNAWLTIRQRGDGPFTAAEYTADRWKKIGSASAGHSVSLGNNGMTITSGGTRLQVRQLFEDSFINALLGKTVTFSVMLSDGTIKSGTGTIPNTLPSTLTSVATATTGNLTATSFSVQSGNASMIQISITDGLSETIKAVKLEIGSASTLANDAPPNYADELLKCQRYYTKIVSGSNYPMIFGVAHSDTQVRAVFTLPTEMRTRPTVSPSGVTGMDIRGGGVIRAVTSISYFTHIGGNMYSVYFGASGLTAAEMYAFCPNTALEFSADL